MPGSISSIREILTIDVREGAAMGLSWQQGPLSEHGVGHFLTAEPLPERLLYAEPLRRRMRVRYGGTWIADINGPSLRQAEKAGAKPLHKLHLFAKSLAR